MSVLIQRPLRGSRVSSFYPVKTLPALSSLDSAFQLQEYISLLIRLNVHDVDRIVAVPGKTDNDAKDDKDRDFDDKEKKDVVVDQACWIYEQLRRLAQDLSHPLITTLQQECTRLTCPEMKAGEWLYLCVAHGTEGAMEQCCAIDYILHTLDSATALLNSPRAFPSRLHIDKTSHRHFSSLARRLGRIFAHAYFHHREAFEQAEAESSLYARFLALTTKFELVPAEFQVIPTRPEDTETSYPRLLAAGVSANDLASPDEAPEDWQQRNPPGLKNESPRKMGRARTDTMVYSEAFSVVEELAKEEEAVWRENADKEDKPSSPEPEPIVDEVAAAETDGPGPEPLPAHPDEAPEGEGHATLHLEPELEAKEELQVTASSSTALPEHGAENVEDVQGESPVLAETPGAPKEEEEESAEVPKIEVTPSADVAAEDEAKADVPTADVETEPEAAQETEDPVQSLDISEEASAHAQAQWESVFKERKAEAETENESPASTDTTDAQNDREPTSDSTTTTA